MLVFTLAFSVLTYAWMSGESSYGSHMSRVCPRCLGKPRSVIRYNSCIAMPCICLTYPQPSYISWIKFVRSIKYKPAVREECSGATHWHLMSINWGILLFEMHTCMYAWCALYASPSNRRVARLSPLLSPLLKQRFWWVFFEACCVQIHVCVCMVLYTHHRAIDALRRLLASHRWSNAFDEY